jgi:hypothetical protein
VNPDKQTPPSAAGIPGDTGERKHTTAAGIASLLLPGLGQIYNDQPWKAVLFIFPAAAVSVMEYVWRTPLPAGTVVIAVIAAYDAYRTGKRMNAGEIPFRKARPAAFIGFAILVLAIIVLVLTVIPLNSGGG